MSRLPRNPYMRSPIKRRKDLPARDRELGEVRYYFDLLANGHTPHLALIGPRGVGKTSMLNACDAIARDLHLVPIRVDLDEGAAASSSQFWLRVYASLLESLAEAGCWGGSHGAIFRDLYHMLHLREKLPADRAVLRIPYIHSHSLQGLESAFAIDREVTVDLNACVTEAVRCGKTGMVFLIDEADCLGLNLPLLQTLRNIFQASDNAAVVLAGTENVFPAIKEVFSPIPRQFHRIDILPLTHWVDTRDLVLSPADNGSSPAAAALRGVMPTDETIHDLHDLCGGSPDELQLYCHHMYRVIERESTDRMELSPRVFQAVMKEFRSVDHSAADLLDKIEQLPRALLTDAKWARRRGLTCDENVAISMLEHSLKHRELPDSDFVTKTRAMISEGYRKLFASGITNTEAMLDLRGGALTRTYWRSHAKSVYGVSFQWSDLDFRETVEWCIADACARSCRASALMRLEPNAQSLSILQRLRKGHAPPCDPASVVELVRTMKLASLCDAHALMDLHFSIPAGDTVVPCGWRLLFKDPPAAANAKPAAWFDSVSTVLAANGENATFGESQAWLPPSEIELFHLTRASHLPLPSEWDPLREITELFDNGRITQCIALFTELLRYTDDAQLRNNLGFCQLIAGRRLEALNELRTAITIKEMPLARMNEAVVLLLDGDVLAARSSIDRAWELAMLSGNAFAENERLLYAAILDRENACVEVKEEMLLGDAILENLHRFGFLSDVAKAELRAQHAPPGLTFASDPPQTG
jgi:hypothetical protein